MVINANKLQGKLLNEQVKASKLVFAYYLQMSLLAQTIEKQKNLNSQEVGKIRLQMIKDVKDKKEFLTIFGFIT